MYILACCSYPVNHKSKTKVTYEWNRKKWAHTYTHTHIRMCVCVKCKGMKIIICCQCTYTPLTLCHHMHISRRIPTNHMCRYNKKIKKKKKRKKDQLGVVSLFFSAIFQFFFDISLVFVIHTLICLDLCAWKISKSTLVRLCECVCVCVSLAITTPGCMPHRRASTALNSFWLYYIESAHNFFHIYIDVYSKVNTGSMFVFCAYVFVCISWKKCRCNALLLLASGASVIATTNGSFPAHMPAAALSLHYTYISSVLCILATASFTSLLLFFLLTLLLLCVFTCFIHVLCRRFNPPLSV